MVHESVATRAAPRTRSPRRAARRVGLYSAFFGAMLARSSQAAEPSCTDSRVAVEGTLSRAWLDALASTCAALGSDSDPDARLSVIAAADGVIVEVVLRDGRQTLRRVHRPEDLARTVRALMTVPTSEDRAPATAEATGAARAGAGPNDGAETALRPVEAPRAQADTAAAHGAPASSSGAASGATRGPSARERSGADVSLEVAVSIVGRVGAPGTYLSLGPAAEVAVRIDAWAIGAAGRWDAYEQVVPGYYRGFEMDGLGASLFVTRAALRTASARVDAGFSGGFLHEQQLRVVGPADEELSGSKLDARFAAIARASLGEGPWRWLVSLEPEVSPLRIRRAARIDPALPKLPAFSIGLGTGVEWAGP